MNVLSFWLDASIVNYLLALKKLLETQVERLALNMAIT